MRAASVRFEPSSGWSAPLPAWDSPATLVLVFAASGFADDQAPLDEVLEAYPTSVIIGCSTAGEIDGVAVSDDSVVVATVEFEATRLRLATTSVPEIEDSVLAGKALAADLIEDDLSALFVLSDGLHINGSALVAGINDVVPEGIVVTGGLAGDGSRFERTWIMANGRPIERTVAAVGLYGSAVSVGHGSMGGWDQFGPERVVTRSQGSVLYELDGQPALALYKKYLGELADGLPASALLFPLLVRETTDADREVVRTVLAVDEESQSMTFAGDIPQGARAQLMRANFDRLVDGAECAASSASDGVAGAGQVVAIAISCVGRKLVLGARVEDEVEATLDVLPEGTLQVGFYSNGELSPYATGTCELHNQTMTLTTIAERPSG